MIYNFINMVLGRLEPAVSFQEDFKRVMSNFFAKEEYNETEQT